ncbi:aspartate ammonia-lyase [Thermotomaculum hydrothermale]|uniref:Aspartate ammonia-lyase n=1 Tax=Thermotomaculum hydrothermale TaxID=981385 RepID=A0A7R6SY05_9BACT|nr:lyase family protein [Thermotomaculum hydrothermale]BBB32056.1 aspartate ammonia-lyase [Thermotomaculum hydrothermale]
MERDFYKETKKAKENFPVYFAFPPGEFIQSIFEVKLAALRVNYSLNFIEREIFEPMEEACFKGIEGEFNRFFPSLIQGGAGTSLNMAANEAIAFYVKEKYGKVVSLYDKVNLHQSTNDVIPSAVKITCMKLSRKLENSVLMLLNSLEKRERDFDGLVKPGLTQMQFAVPITLGREFSAYSSAISRDRWRVSKIIERLKELNIGGTAIGTGFKAPKKYIFSVINELRKITGLPVARAENLIDATQNLDVYVEVSGILTALSVNLFKIAGDLRFLSCSHINQIILKEVQAGSSIMPGKVNPVLPEFVQSCAIKVQSNHVAIQTACSNGNLELNPFLPLIAHSLFESFKLLTVSCEKLKYCIDTLQPNIEEFEKIKYNDFVVLYALSTIIGYEKAKNVFENAKEKEISVYKFAIENGIVSKKELDEALTPENLLKLGF